MFHALNPGKKEQIKNYPVLPPNHPNSPTRPNSAIFLALTKTPSVWPSGTVTLGVCTTDTTRTVDILVNVVMNAPAGENHHPQRP